MLDGKNGDLGQFLDCGSQGQTAPRILVTSFQAPRFRRDELVPNAGVVQHIGHIKEIVAMQQSYAKVFGLMELWRDRPGPGCPAHECCGLRASWRPGDPTIR